MKNISKALLLLSISAISFACNPFKSKDLTGVWRATLFTQDQEIPFTLLLSETPEKTIEASIKNGEEVFNLGIINLKEDSIIIPLSIFDAELKGTVKDGEITGIWKKHYVEDYEIPFTAEKGNSERFLTADTNLSSDFEGKYAVTFRNNEGKETKAVGTFITKNGTVQGTFMTPTGDYRFLEGNVINNQLFLSTFNGEHAFLFKADIAGDDLINGEFWSGKGGYKTWEAVKDENASLPDPNKLTFLKDGFDKISFKFPDLSKRTISFEDEKYKDKALVIQILGTWCPNCLDETVFLSDWYDKNHGRGVEVIGLAFEMKDDFEYNKSRVQKMKERLGINYDLLIGGSHKNGGAAKALPMLNHVMSFPTTIFIDKNKVVRKIHTGFNGPGTGQHYEEFVSKFNLFMDKIIGEDK